MKKYKLYKEQKINASLTEVWDFFSSPKNLNFLTPDDMGFQIISDTALDKMYQGQEIEYKVSPILNIPMYWKTEITKVIDHELFIDEQNKGPYKLWIHKHQFISKDNHILMIDDLQYAMPFGWLGTLVHEIYVKNRLEEIFNYRYQKVEELFNAKSKSVNNLIKANCI